MPRAPVPARRRRRSPRARRGAAARSPPDRSRSGSADAGSPRRAPAAGRRSPPRDRPRRPPTRPGSRRVGAIVGGGDEQQLSRSSGRSACWAVNERSSRSVSGTIGSLNEAADFGSSTSASGLPAATASSRRRVAAGRSAPSNARALASSSGPSAISVPSPANGPPSRWATIIATGSNSIRRATNASTSALAASSHCASSISATTRPSPVSRFSAASPTRKWSGTVASASPSPDSSASRCGAGQPLHARQQRAQQPLERRERQRHLGLHARRRQHAPARARAPHQQRRLPDPRRPLHDDDPTGAVVSTNRASAACSCSRPITAFNVACLKSEFFYSAP